MRCADYGGRAASPDSPLPEGIRDWCSQIDVDETAAELAAPGVNILGHFCYPSGLRTSVEAIRDALGYAGVHVSLRDIRTDQSDDPNHVNFTGMELYDTTIVHTQPQPFFDVAFERADLFERIGLSPLWITQPISCGRYTKNGTGLANWERRPRTMQGPGCLCRVLANEWQSGSRRFR